MKKKINSILSADDNVEFAYLFGSYADGSAEDSSDIDIAVYLQDLDIDMRLDLHHKLQKALHKDIDLVILNEAKNIYLLKSILYQDIVLKDHPKRTDFELKKEHEIKDFLAFRNYIDAA